MALSALTVLVLCASLVAGQEASAEDQPLPPQDEDGAAFDDEYDAGVGGDDFFEASPHWLEMRARLQRSIDADGLLRARRWGNIANGALLAATGPIAFTVSLFGLKLSNVVLSLYVTAFGGVLAGIELGLAPVAPWVHANLGYLTTAHGRTALLAFMGGLTWPLGRLGLVPALLTCANAMFNANFAKLLAFVSADDAKHGASASGGTGASAAAGGVGDADAKATGGQPGGQQQPGGGLHDEAELRAALERAEAEAQAQAETEAAAASMAAEQSAAYDDAAAAGAAQGQGEAGEMQ